jgi:hypothetical protein
MAQPPCSRAPPLVMRGWGHMLNESNHQTVSRSASGRAPMQGASLTMGPSPASVWTRTNSTGIAGLLLFLACVSNGSPPPAPSPEASSEGRAIEPAPARTPPAPTSPRASPSAGSSSPAAAAELRRELSALPVNVLAGTDVVALADYLASAVPIPQSGAFRSDQGGATAEVRVMPGPQGVTLTREFTEPGTKTQTKRYDGLQARANGVRLSSANLEVLGMQQSLLVLEKHSGVDGIPDSLWIEYERAAERSPAQGD